MDAKEKEEFYTKEIINASTFFMRQIKRGWTFEEAYQQLTGSYGFRITNAVMEALNRSLSKSV